MLCLLRQHVLGIIKHHEWAVLLDMVGWWSKNAVYIVSWLRSFLNTVELCLYIIHDIHLTVFSCCFCRILQGYLSSLRWLAMGLTGKSIRFVRVSLFISSTPFFTSDHKYVSCSKRNHVYMTQPLVKWPLFVVHLLCFKCVGMPVLLIWPTCVALLFDTLWVELTSSWTSGYVSDEIECLSRCVMMI